MVSGRSTIRRAASASALLGVAVLASCGYAKRDDVNAQFETLRTEMASADQQLDGRISQLDGRVNGIETRTAALERDLQSLRTDFNATVERMEGMLAFNMPVNFEFDEADVRPDDQPVLQRFAEVVKGYYPNAIITVEGFTDPSGSRAYNERLGMERAEAVKAYLLSQGLTDAQVRVVSYGEEEDRLVRPDASGPGAEGQENRRVSLVIDYTDRGMATDRAITSVSQIKS
jgi:peptidoglycan-associated lipoprotein